VTVVDAENFAGYDDESPTAKLQAKFCDVILIVSYPLQHVKPLLNVVQNKWEYVMPNAYLRINGH
jgi:G3E family GTPase